MIRKSAGELETGMILAEPVYDMQGVLLLKAQTVITTKNIQVLKAWGVSRVWIEGEAEEGGGETAKQEIRDVEAIEEELIQRCMAPPHNTAMTTILKTAAKLIAERTVD